MNLLLNASSWKSKLLPYLIVFTLLILTSCDKEKVTPIVKNDTAINGVPSIIVSKLQAAGFDTSEGLRKFEDGYLVEYDIFLTEKMIDDLAAPKSTDPNARKAKTEHYRTNNLVVGIPRTIRVYMDPGFNSNMQSSLNRAPDRYNSLNMGLKFQRINEELIADIRVISFYEVSEVMGSSVPPFNGNPGHSIKFNLYYFSGSADATTTIAHELGHAIGFRHTDYMDRKFSCPVGGYEGNGDGINHIPGTPTGPSDRSWMLACLDVSNDRPFTTADITALTTLYPVKSLPTGVLPFQRYYNPSIKKHGYANNTNKFGTFNGYTLIETAYYAHSTQVANSVPVYSYKNTNGNHFYTTDYSELGAGNGKDGYNSDGVLCYAFRTQVAGTVPVYRYYSKELNTHYFTTNKNSMVNVTNYYYDRIAFYTYPY